MEQQLQQLVDQVQRLTTESQNMRQELQNRDVTIAEMRGQLQAQQQAQQQRVAPRGEMMDPKILHKVKPFDGHRASWKTFSFQYRAYLIAQDRRYRDLLERCEDGAQEVDNVNLDAQEEELSTQLYYGLVLAMPEDSVGELIVRNSPVGEGAECWRKLQKEYNPSEAGNVLAMWTKLTDTKFDAKEDVMVSISKLDEDMTRYQKMAGEPVSDLIKRGILTKALKDHDELQKHVFRNSSRLSTYELLRAEVVSALMAERAVQDDPMEIGALKGGKRPWKGRGKGKDGKGKERPPNPDAEIECHYCHKKGHRSANCRKRIADEKNTSEKDKKDKKQLRLKKRSHTIDWKYCLPSYHQYVCCSCKKTFEGWRWHFDQWKLDYCAACAEYCLDNWFKDEEEPDDNEKHVTVAGLRPVDEDQSPADDRLRLAPLRNAIMLDSGAQISAIPRSQVTKHNYTPTDSNVVGLKGIGGEEIERYGHVELNLSRGGEVIQVGAEVADVEYPVVATDAVVQRGQSVLHSPAGHWIINGTVEPPDGAEFVPLRRHQGNYYLEYDHIIDGQTQPEASKVAAVRKTLPRKVPAEQEAGSLPKVLGPEADETTTVPTRVLKTPHQPSAAERAAHEGHHLPFRPWCPICVQARADDDPHHAQEPADENKIPKVMFDIFYVGTDQLAAKYKLKGGYFSIREKMSVTKAELDQAVSVLNVIDCKILAQATLYANKETDDYKVSFLLGVLEAWGHTTVILQTDQEPATMALAQAVRDRRSHSTLVRGSPPFSKQSAGYAEGANKLAAGLLRAYKLKLEHKLGCEIKMTDPIVPWLVNSVGWMITRFQPRSHGGSSYKMLYGKEYNGEIAEMGEQVWYRISARVAAGRGKWEARFAKGIWVGKSELDDTHLVIDPERGVQKVRTVRRMPEEFRWQPELIQHIRVTPWKQTPDKSSGTIGRSMYITERMIDAHGPTDECRKCSTGYGSHSAACRQRFETIQADLLREKLAKDPVAPEATAEVQTAMDTESGELRSDFRRSAPGEVREGAEVKKPRVASIGHLSVCELAVCEEGYDESFDPMWDPHPKRSARCSERCEKHSSRCQLRECHQAECACRRCLMSHIGTIRSHFGDPEDQQVEQMVEVSAELHEKDQWSPKTIHYDYYTGEPLDEDLYQKGRDDELQAMKDYGVYVEVATSTATDGKHIGGFPIAHMKEGKVRWRFVATEVNKYEVREDNHQGTPPLMIVRATLSRAASSPTSSGQHLRKIQAMNGTRKASQMWGELVRTTMDDGHWECLVGTPNVFYLPASPNTAPFDEDSTAICHGDDFLAEGYDEQLDELDELLKQQFEVTASARLGPGAVGQTTYLKRTIGYTDKLPGCEEPGFFWTADPKHVDFMIKWTQKRGCKPAPTPGTKATGQGRRDSLDLLSKDRAREVAGAAGTALYLSSDRPDTMYASKTAMQHVSNPNVLMHARVQRLGRYYEGQPVLVWCYPLQGTPEGIRVDGDADWAPTSELQRRSTSGGAVRYGDHTWDCYSVTQSTIALSSGESEMYATGSATARGLQCKTYLIETQRPCNLKIYSDSTAGRGMCSRVGVGKVRHLELRYLWIQERLRLKAFELHKEDTSKMTADMLTKYSEWPTIEKHCTTLNLRFGKQMTGLSAMAVFTEVVTKASGEKVTVYGGSDEVAVCPAPVSHYVESEEFRFYLMLGLVMVTAASTFLLGCWCGCYFKNFYDKFFLQGAVSPASGSTCPPSARADVEFKTVCAQQDKGARHKLLNTFLVAELRAVLKAKSLAVSGIKEDLVTRMIKHGGVLSDRQAKEIEQLRVMATAHGPLAKLSLQDISSPEAAQKWIETFKGECRDRSRGSQVIHGEG
ncbi:unnamed protein product [Prorocentrum cordatum]|uniref:Retrovirus-related Pol polyprotein from transposon TNT 1-94 n=1 Tax=Prorocentrum cordatum TaxID=2364126 RepID=A0ABN9QZA7_9DINO|nr:unnamed protein product [Polarella glacialis]